MTSFRVNKPMHTLPIKHKSHPHSSAHSDVRDFILYIMTAIIQLKLSQNITICVKNDSEVFTFFAAVDARE